MATIALSDILDDIKCAEEGLHEFERSYWIGSADFIQFCSQGLLDEGDNSEDFSE